MKPRRGSRAAAAQRRYARIEMEHSMQETAQLRKIGPTISPEDAIEAIEDGRCPFDMARAANEALRSK